MFFMSIPKIGEEEIKRRYSRIKPVITLDGKLYNFRDYTTRELREISYYANRERDVREPIPEGELEVWEGHDFDCLHSYGYPHLFKPCVCEVLAQLSQFDIERVKAFEIITEPRLAKEEQKTSFHKTAFNNGFHVSTVRLYIAKKKK